MLKILDPIEKYVIKLLDKHKIKATKMLTIDLLLWILFGLLYLFHLGSLISQKIQIDNQKETNKNINFNDALNPIKLVFGTSLITIIIVMLVYIWKFIIVL
mgnify:CR=1 FL=1